MTLEFNKPKENRPKASLTDFEAKLTAQKAVEQIPIKAIVPFDYHGESQPFTIDKNELKALQNSIKENGQLTPIIVRKVNEHYQILSGHKRFAACKNLNFEAMEAVVIEVESDEKAFDIVCQANVQRRDPKPSELCRIFNTYLNMRKDSEAAYEITADKICEQFNVSRKTMYRYANMNKLIPDISFLIDEKKIRISAIESLSHLSENQQLAVADYINSGKALSVGNLKAVVEYFLLNKNFTDVEEALNAKNQDELKNSETKNAVSETKTKSADLICQIRNKFKDFSSYTDDEICEYVMLAMSDKEAKSVDKR